MSQKIFVSIRSVREVRKWVDEKKNRKQTEAKNIKLYSKNWFNLSLMKAWLEQNEREIEIERFNTDTFHIISQANGNLTMIFFQFLKTSKTVFPVIITKCFIIIIHKNLTLFLIDNLVCIFVFNAKCFFQSSHSSFLKNQLNVIVY